MANNPCLTPCCCPHNCMKTGLNFRIDQQPCCPLLPCWKNPYGCCCPPRCPCEPTTVFFKASPPPVPPPSCPNEEELCKVPLHRLECFLSSNKCPPNREIRPGPGRVSIPFYHIEGSCPVKWGCPFSRSEEAALTGRRS